MFKVGDLLVPDMTKTDNGGKYRYSLTRDNCVIKVMEIHDDERFNGLMLKDREGNTVYYGGKFPLEFKYFKLYKKSKPVNKFKPGDYVNRSTYKTSPYT